MKKITFLFALLCASVMGFAGTTPYCNVTSPNANFTFSLMNVSGNLYRLQYDAIGDDKFSGTINNANCGVNQTEGAGIYFNNTSNWVITDERAYYDFTTATATSVPTNFYTGDMAFGKKGGGEILIYGLNPSDIDWSAACSESPQCTDETAPSVSAVVVSDETYNSAVLTITAADNDGGSGISQYIVKNGDTQIASSASNVITLTNLSAGTTYNNIKVYAKDGCNNVSSVFAVDAFQTLNRPSECSGDLGHWGNPSVKRISYTIEYLPVIDKIKYTVRGYNTEVLTYLEIRTTSGVSGSLTITDGVAMWFQDAPVANTEMAIQFYYGLQSLGEGREITADGAVSLSNAQCTYYKSHDCAASSYPTTVPAAPDDKNDCQVFSIFGTEGFATNATGSYGWDGAKSYLTGKIDGKEVFYTTAGTTANIQYAEKNINAYDKLHFDIWTDAAREIGVELCINAGTHGNKQNITTTAGAWKSVELDVTGFHNPKDVNTTFFFLSSLAHETYYVANVYLYKTAADESCYETLNIALNKPVIAGYTPGNPSEAPSKANDGKDDTEWTTWQNRPASEEWWYVDLLHVYNLNNISILWGGDYSTNYILQTRIDEPTVEQRADDAAWTTVATVTDAAASAVKSSNISAVGRYVRIHSLARSNQDLLRMKEVRVYATGLADLDTEKPVMESASLVSKTHNQAVIAVSATDDKGIASYHVVDAGNSIDAYFVAEAGNITVTGLSSGISYTFTITAVDFFDKESENSKSVSVTTDTYLTEPAATATAPTWPTDQVKAVYSPTYSADCNFANWGGCAAYTADTYGKKFVMGASCWGFGLDGYTLNCLAMEKLHVDIWIADNATVNLYPIYGGTGLVTDDSHYKELHLTGQQWNSIDMDLASDFAGLDLSSIFQFKIANAQGLTFWIGNLYFYRESAIVDGEAPTNVDVNLNAEGFYSAKINARAQDNSGAVNFKVLNGTDVVATGSAATNVTTIIRVDGLTPNTNYNFSVVAYDEAGNEAAPEAVAATTKALPTPAPTPNVNGKQVIAVFSDAIEGAPDAIQSGGWGESTIAQWIDIVPGDKVFYAQNFNWAGWHSWGDDIDARTMVYLHVDVYSTGMTSVSVTPISHDPTREGSKAITLTPNAWTSIDIELNDYQAAEIAWNKIFQFKFMDPANGDEFMVDNVYFWKNPDMKRDDPWMAPGELGTICIPNGAIAYGGDIYELVGKDEVGKIVFSTVANNHMEPGKPYLFEATSNEMTFFYTAEETASQPDNSGAMKGTFVYEELTELENVYYFADHALWSCVDLTQLIVPANRAYVKLNEVEPINNPTPMPGRKFITMGVNGKNTVTGCEQLNAAEAPVKMMIDGQLFIMRGEKLYDATGRLVK